MNVLGLDLSLASTGCSDGHETHTFKPKSTGYIRLRDIRQHVIGEAVDMKPRLICVEGPSFASKGGHEHERGGLWWMVCEQLDAIGFDVAVVPPSSLKKYATGKGNANKDAMILAAARRFPWFAGGNDEADALFLAALGFEHLSEPLVRMPALNQAALDGVAWPARWVAA
jgi:crossover junction endodeoxyribonuclease RuvC